MDDKKRKAFRFLPVLHDKSQASKSANKEKKMKLLKNKKTTTHFTSAFLFLLIGVVLFFAGLHNIDLHQNFNYLAQQEGFDLSQYTEHNIKGEPVDIDEMYLHGVQMQLAGILFIIISWFCKK